MIRHGLILGGQIVPGTDEVLSDSRFWVDAGHHSTRDRQGAKVELVTLHWTAGHTSHEDSAGPNTFAAMLARKRPDGSPLDCMVNFVVGWGGSIWQLADVLTACVHVGNRDVIRRSVSVEHRWPGTHKGAVRLGYDAPHRKVHVVGDRDVEIMEPSSELLAASQRLAEMLAALDHPRVSIPRIVPTTNARMTSDVMRKRAGAVEHGQMPGSTKIDCCGVLNENLADIGWQRR